jgi:hypothetical protein
VRIGRLRPNGRLCRSQFARQFVGQVEIKGGGKSKRLCKGPVRAKGTVESTVENLYHNTRSLLTR